MKSASTTRAATDPTPYEAREAAAEVDKTHKAIVGGAFEGERLSLSRVRSQVPPGTYSKAMLMEKTGLTLNEFRALKARGKLQPVGYSDKGWPLYDDTTIASLQKRPNTIEHPFQKIASIYKKHAHRYSAQEGVAVFQHLEKGTPAKDIVVKVGIHPALVNTIREDYALLSRAVIVPRAVMDQLNRFEGKIEGVFPIQDAEDLLRLIERLVTRGVCGHCKERPKKFCSTCASEKFASRFVPAERIDPDTLTADAEIDDALPPPEKRPVILRVGDDTMSAQIIRFVEQHPEASSGLVQEHLGGSAAGTLTRLAAEGHLTRQKATDGTYRYWVRQK